MIILFITLQTELGYLTSYLKTNDNPVYNTRTLDLNNIRGFRAKTEHFNRLFSPFCVNELYKLDSSLTEAESVKHLKLTSNEFSNLKKRSLFEIIIVEIIKAKVAIQSCK